MKKIYAHPEKAEADNFKNITETSFDIVLKDEIEYDNLLFKGFASIMSNTGGFANSVIFIFTIIFGEWMVGMRYLHQAQ